MNEASKNCGVFRERRGYLQSPMSQSEADFPIAFSLVVHKGAGLVERLLRAIYRPQNFYCVHVDSKADPAFYQAMRSLADCFSNVFVASRRATVHWGYYGVLEAEIICLRELLKHSKWKYFINLTGEEFPLKTNKDIVQILQVMNGSNSISNLVVA